MEANKKPLDDAQLAKIHDDAKKSFEIYIQIPRESNEAVKTFLSLFIEAIISHHIEEETDHKIITDKDHEIILEIIKKHRSSAKSQASGYIT